MREILFRGKRRDNRKWIEGSLVSFLNYKSAAILVSKSTAFFPKKSTTFCTNSCYEVIPETVGQYTGLIDKNGRKIFEGDIVEIPLFVTCKEPTVAVVVWNELYAKFGLEAESIKTDFYYYFSDEMKVIGNLHDNPELLKGGAGK